RVRFIKESSKPGDRPDGILSLRLEQRQGGRPLGKPNQFLDVQHTLVGSRTPNESLLFLLLWVALFVAIVGALVCLLGNSKYGLVARAIGENPKLSSDLAASNNFYTFSLLFLANATVGLGGALFVQRSFSADVNMGTGITIIGLAAMILGLLIAARTRSLYLSVSALVVGGVVYKSVIFVSLEFGLPAESFRLVSALALLAVFPFMKMTQAGVLRGLKWN
ncbi:MAG: hypothetical protein AAGB04_28170, partial [Pseudomonadota bacterium]